jgi:hypothetical protein
MLAQIRRLYAIESDAKELDADARRALRQEKSLPILLEICDWLHAQISQVLPSRVRGHASRCRRVVCLALWCSGLAPPVPFRLTSVYSRRKACLPAAAVCVKRRLRMDSSDA